MKLTGAEAQRYLKHELKDMKAKSYQITDASDSKVQEHFDKTMASGRKLTSEEAKSYDANKNKYGTSENARVVDQYDLFNNNCTTKSIEGAKAGGTNADFVDTNEVPASPDVPNVTLYNTVNTPVEAETYLNTQSKETNSNVKEDSAQKKKEIEQK
jgi:hypothetical protein